MRKILFSLSLFLACHILYGATNPNKTEDSKQVKTALSQVQHQIKKIEKTIYRSQHQEKVLTQQLATLEKEMGENEEQMRTFKNKLKEHQKAIGRLKLKESHLLKTKKAHEEALAQLLQATFTHQHEEKLRLLLEQNEWSSFARMNQYYHFFCLSRAKQLAHLQDNLQKINALQQQLKQEQQTVQGLTQKVAAQQKTLKTNKQKRKSLLVQLNQQLGHATQELSQLQKQEQHLEQLFKTLDQKLATTPTYIEPAQDFAKMKRQLPFPIHLASVSLSTLPHHKAKQARKTFMAAPAGTPITAVSGGRVVFAEWLRGIGLLIILDHGHGYMTLYGNNQKLYKSLGDWVKPGEMIARVGQSGGHAEPGLYFEIRKNGEALDPTLWLKQEMETS